MSAVVTAVDRYVASYETTAASPQASGPSEPAPDPETAAAGLQQALSTANDQLSAGCDKQAFVDGLKDGLAGVRAESDVALAVFARITANLTGATGNRRSVPVGEGEDLLAAVATAAPGATLNLAAGEYRLSHSLVLLDGITLSGAGREETRLVSSATDVSVLVISPDLVGLEQLTVSRDHAAPGSVLIASASTSVSLDAVTLEGARTSSDKRGGAGLDLASASGTTSPGRTTVQLTDVVLRDNAWAGLAVGGGHRVSVLTSRFADNGQCGACFIGAAEGSIERSRFTGNGVGVAVVGTSTAVLGDNRIAGGDVGIQVGDQATPTISGNRVSGSKRAALIYTNTAGGVLKGTTCSGVDVGIVLSAKALPSLSGNDCTLARAST